MKKRLLERGLSLLLAFVMVLALVPVFTIEAEAAGTTVDSLGALESALRNYSEITLSSDIAITKDLTIPSNVTVIVPNNRKLVVPYDENQTTVNGANAIDASTPAFSYANAGEIASTSNLKHPGNSFAVYTLTMENGAVIEVQSGGVLAVGGEYSSAGGLSGQTAGNYSQIKMEAGAEINVLNGGVLSSVGYITGDGTINLASGAKAYEPFVIGDYQGGTYTVASFHGGTVTGTYSLSNLNSMINSVGTDNGIMPFVSYSLFNIQSKIVMDSAAALLGYCDLYTGAAAGVIEAQHNKTIITVIGASESIFNLDAGSKAVLTYTEPKTDVTAKMLGQTTMEVFGNCKFGSLRLTLDVLGDLANEVQVDSQDIFFSLPYSLKIIVQDKGSLTVPSGNKVKLLPGSEIYIKEGATLEVAEGGTLIAYDGLDTSVNNSYYPSTSILSSVNLSQRGRLVVDGIMNMNGAFGGKIETSGTGKVVVGKDAVTTVSSYEGVEAGWGLDFIFEQWALITTITKPVKLVVSSTTRTQHTQTAQIVMHESKYGNADKLVTLQPGQTYYGVSAEEIQKDTSYSYTFDPSSAKTPKTANFSGEVSLQGTWSTSPVVYDDGTFVSTTAPSAPADSVIYYTDETFTETTETVPAVGVVYYKICNHVWDEDECGECGAPRYSVKGETVTFYYSDYEADIAIAAAYNGDKMVVCDVNEDGSAAFALPGLKADMTVKIFLLDENHAPIDGYVPKAKPVD